MLTISPIKVYSKKYIVDKKNNKRYNVVGGSMIIFLNYFLLFIIYSFLGWLIEIIVCSISEKHFTPRGFLIGPYCPIYGFASIIMITLLNKYFNDPLIVFILSAIIASVLEYFTSYIMEKIFNARWWDYSDRKLNINGRICLENSVLFGMLALILIYIVNPFIIQVIDTIPKLYFIFISSVLLTIFIIDNIVTFNIMFKIRTFTKALKKDYTEEMTKKVRKALLEHSFITRNILKSFPKLEIKGFESKKEKIFNFINSKKSSLK